MEEEPPHCSDSPSSLLCFEQHTCFDDEEEEKEISSNELTSYSVSETEEEEYVQLLLDRETTFESFKDSSFMTQDWLKCARVNAIEWIFKMREAFEFSFLTAYLSVTYLDRFLSQRSIQDGKPWAIQLLSVACLSLAAKMEETNIPALSEFGIENYNFESKTIQRMELLVLNTLRWRMACVTPFGYLHYFVTKLSNNESPSLCLLSTSIAFIMTTIKEMSLIPYQPSEIAMAAVLAALNKGLMRKMVEVKIGLVSSCGSLESDHVFSCYNLMVELENRKSRTPSQFLISSDLYSSSKDVYDDTDLTSSSSSSRTKRRRLTFDQNYEMPNEKKRLH